MRQLGTALGEWLRLEWPWLRWLLLLLALATVVAVLWPLPPLFTRHPSYGLTAAERLKATNDVRTTLVQALGGVAFLGGLFYTARTFRLNATGLDLSLQEQLTERYTKAVEQLGSQSLDVRLGGIYALERLMIDSPRDHPTIVEVLAAFIREHSVTPEGERKARAAIDASPKDYRLFEMPKMPEDTAAAASVIARRPPGRDERGILNFSNCYLHGADLSGANLSRANLFDANLSHANLSHANLASVYALATYVADADLTGADLGGANLHSALLVRVDLIGVNLTEANLVQANLHEADLTEANLTNAKLSNADLSNADVSGARGVTMEQLNQAATLDGAMLPDYLSETSLNYD